MMTLNLLDAETRDDRNAWPVGDIARAISGPARVLGATWIKIEVVGGCSGSLSRHGSARKVYPYIHTQAPKAPWEDR